MGFFFFYYSGGHLSRGLAMDFVRESGSDKKFMGFKSVGEGRQ